MIVLDASAALSALLNAGQARQVLAAEQAHAPHLIDCEVANGLRRLVRAGQLDAGPASVALDRWRHLGITRYPIRPLLPRMWALSSNLSAYDASYVALAEHLGIGLVTTDARLAGAPGVGCSVTVVSRSGGAPRSPG